MQFQRRPNSDRSPESLEARLRALPQPPIPSELEARILAAIPARPSNSDELPRLARTRIAAVASDHLGRRVGSGGGRLFTRRSILARTRRSTHCPHPCRRSWIDQVPPPGHTSTTERLALVHGPPRPG